MNSKMTLPLVCLLAICLAGCGAPRGPRGQSAPPSRSSVAGFVASSQGTDRYSAGTLQTGAQRADPGYIQHLEKQSMLDGAVQAARIVSGSQLAWQNPAAPPSTDMVLRMAPSWLAVNPISLLTDPRRPAFSTLAGPVIGQILDAASLGGLYVSPTGGSGRLWAYERDSGFGGDDIVQFGFSEMAGSEEDYRRLLQTANNANRLLGLDAVPAATGMGPDFFLATRGTRNYPGLYCMVEIPREYWNLLPAAASQWLGAPLDRDAARSLASRGLLPPAMPGDSLSFPLRGGRAGGWAATAEIHGIDGAARRWAYRYHGAPEYPVLNWEDPSRTARQVFAGSIIQNVGLQGAALVGLSLEGLYGLEAAPQEGPQAGMVHPGLYLEPGRAASIDLGRELRRYGGWSLLRDELPLAALEGLMAEGPDFFIDSVTSPAAEHALLTGNATLLRFMMDAFLRTGIDSRRLVHAMPAERGISYALPHLADMGNRFAGTEAGDAARELRAAVLRDAAATVDAARFDSPRGRDRVPFAGDTLYTTSAGLAALALGAGNAENVGPELVPHIMQGQLLLAFFKAMQPGLFLLNGSDMAGSLPLSWWNMRDSGDAWDISLAPRGGYSFLEGGSSLLVTTGGLPRAKTIYSAADIQIQDKDSFVSRLGTILGLRKRLAVAEGELHGRYLVNGRGTIAFSVLLPTNTSGSGALVVICNFSRDRVTETVDLTGTPELNALFRQVRQGGLTLLTSNGDMKEYTVSALVQVTLEPWNGVALIIGGGE